MKLWERIVKGFPIPQKIAPVEIFDVRGFPIPQKIAPVEIFDEDDNEEIEIKHYTLTLIEEIIE